MIERSAPTGCPADRQMSRAPSALYSTRSGPTVRPNAKIMAPSPGNATAPPCVAAASVDGPRACSRAAARAYFTAKQ